MRWKLTFGLASDDLFFVTTRRARATIAGVPVRSKVTTFADEDEFLGYLIRAGLREEQTTRLALAVLLSVAKPTVPPVWTEVDMTERQMELLRLSGEVVCPDDDGVPEGKDIYLRAARSGSLPQFYDLLMQAPTAIAMVTGPEHRYSFLNARYGKMMGTRSIAKTLGASALDTYAGTEKRRFAELLDRIYETGEPYIGVETPRRFFHEVKGSLEDRFVNIVCQPICNAFGDAKGIMIQLTDVTEEVLAREVRESRERLLYRQWAELDAIYRNSPIAMLLIDAKDFRILRLNERQAEMMGAGVAELLGKPLLQTAAGGGELRGLLARVLRGQPVANRVVEGTLASSPRVPRRWLVSYAPTLSEEGRVEAIISVALEILGETRAGMDAAALPELALAHR